MNNNYTNKNPKKIIWISYIVLDLYLHVTTQIEILNQMSKLGNDVIFITTRSKKRLIGIPLDIDLRIIPLRHIPFISAFLFSLIIFFLLPIILLIERPDFIITEPGLSIVSFLWRPFFKVFNTKFILDVRSTPVEVIGYRARLRGLWFRISILISKRIFDGITIITHLMKMELCSNFHIDEQFVGVWTSGVNLELFNPSKYNGDEYRKINQLSNKFIVFYHGNLQFTRGIIETVRAIQLLGERYPDIILFLLGKGPALQTLEKMAKNHQDRIIIHESVEYSQVPHYIAMCDVGVVPLPDIPDWRYQCSLKLLEYLAMEKPVIITDIPANRMVVGNSRCGIYLSSIEPEEIAKSIEYVYSNKESIKLWGKYGKNIVGQDYSWNKVAKKLDGYLEELI